MNGLDAARLQRIVAILKKRFTSLTAEEAVELGCTILLAVAEVNATGKASS